MELQEQIFECIATRDWTTAFPLLNEVVDEIDPGKSWALDWLAIFHRLGWGTREDKDRRGYAVSILIDVSLSMQGIFETCAREVMLLFLHSLQQADEHDSSLMLFGECVKVLKLEDQDWDLHTISRC